MWHFAYVRSRPLPGNAWIGKLAMLKMKLLLGGAITAALIGASAVAEEQVPATAISADAAMIAAAELAPPPPPETAVELEVSQEAFPRFTWDAPLYSANQTSQGIELEFAAGGSGSPLDVAVAQRTRIAGDAETITGGAEVRVGHGLVARRAASGERSIYAFVASDNQALTYQPGGRSEFGGAGDAVALQNQVELGDVSAGVTYERNGVQASLAYVEREASTRVGVETFTQDDSFAGVTLTMRN